MINPTTQHLMAQRKGARIRREKVDHTPLVSAPESVIDVVLEAVDSAVRANPMTATCKCSAGFALLAP
jgi:hypothetical protein